MHGPDEGGLEVWDASYAESGDPPRRECGDAAGRAATRMVQGGRRVQGGGGNEAREVWGAGCGMSKQQTTRAEAMFVSARAEAVFVPFADLKAQGRIPRRGRKEGFRHALTQQENAHLCRPKGSFDASKTLFVFVSHRWLSPGGADGHPDDEGGSKYRLLVEAVEKLLQVKHMKAEGWEVALWVDFACVDQDLENPAAELNELHEIIAQADVLLTPVHDPEHAKWDMPRTVINWYDAYQAKPFQEYWGRAWCVLEAMSGACMPVVGGVERAEAFEEGAIKNAILSGRRNHILYGTKESVAGGDPQFLPPLLHSTLKKYNPTKMKLTSEKDRPTIVSIAEGLRKHIKPLKVGYKGEKWWGVVRHGRGTKTYHDGNVYEGEWKDGKWRGVGTHWLANGDMFKGEWKDDMEHGEGTYRWANGSVYEGEWKDGKRHGEGTLRNATGVYKGEWKDNTIQGKGTYQCVDGRVYEGEFENGNCHGKGKMTYADGRVEEGKFENDEFVG